MANESGGLKVYGVYVNPFPGVWFSERRLRSEARSMGSAWWVTAASEEAAWNEVLAAARDKATWEELRRLKEDGNVLIEPKADGADKA